MTKTFCGPRGAQEVFLFCAAAEVTLALTRGRFRAMTELLTLAGGPAPIRAAARLFLTLFDSEISRRQSPVPKSWL